MTWFVGALVLVLAALAGSPWLVAHRALRRRRRRFAKMQRIRFRPR
jgi:hypothetical protein